MESDTPNQIDGNPEAKPQSLEVSRRQIWLEVLCVLAVGVIPNAISAISSLYYSPHRMPYRLDAINLCALSGCTIFVTLYLMSRSGVTFKEFGVTSVEVLDAPRVSFYLIAMAILTGLYLELMPDDGSEFNYPKPRKYWDLPFMFAKFILSALSEELVTRAYLIVRLTQLFNSRFLAVLVAACLFASYHVYQGPNAVVFTLSFGIISGCFFLMYQRIWPLVAGHALYNVYLEMTA